MNKASTSSRLFVDAIRLDEALDHLKRQGDDFTVLAGGTDVMVQYIRGDIRPAAILHVRRLAELRTRALANRTELGAITTHWQMRTDVEMRRRHPALAEAAATVGGRQTQNVGTLAGNVVNASPAADLTPVLLVSDAAVELVSTAGRRRLAIDDFVLGRRQTARRPDELVLSVSLEPLRTSSAETYVKLGRRHAMEVAIAGIAVRLTLGSDRTVKDVRIALGSVAPKPFRCSAAEDSLRGSRLDPAAVRQAAQLVRASAEPIDDARATAGYRNQVLPGLFVHALETCRRRVEEAGD